MAPPNQFSNQQARWVYKRCISSVVHLELRPNAREVKKAMDDISAIPHANVATNAQRERESGHTMTGTGFVIRETEIWVYVITCAHIMGLVFNDESPVTESRVNDMFQIHLICDHREERFLRGKDNPRLFRRGYVAAVNCATDLLLLRFSRSAFHGYCRHRHNPIPLAERFPSPLKTVVMLSWPILRHRTAVLGHTSHEGREIGDLTIENKFGFHMTLSEVNIASEAGSSGSPLIDGIGQCVGILHGGHGGFFSYFISIEDIQQTLMGWGAYLTDQGFEF